MFDFFIDLVGTPLGFVMKWIYDFVGNYGVAIILFTLITKLIVFPIYYKQQKNTAHMQLINPKIAKLREKYKNNPDKLSMEQMKLYQEENINPYASCLPMIISLIILWGVLGVVYEPMTHILKYDNTTITAAREIAAEYNENLALNIEKGRNDMREQLIIMEEIVKHEDEFTEKMESVDPEFVPTVSEFADTFNILGVDLNLTPQWSDITKNFPLFMIPLLSGIVQLAMTIYMQWNQKKRNPDMPNMGAMNIMLYGMPIFSVWLAFTVPAGVGFYWVCSSVFSFIQSIGLNLWFNEKRIEKIGEAERKKAASKTRRPTMMQKLMEQQEELMRQQQGTAGGTKTASNRVRYSDDDEVKLSRKESEEFNTAIIREARRRMAEKYGEDN